MSHSRSVGLPTMQCLSAGAFGKALSHISDLENQRSNVSAGDRPASGSPRRRRVILVVK